MALYDEENKDYLEYVEKLAKSFEIKETTTPFLIFKKVEEEIREMIDACDLNEDKKIKIKNHIEPYVEDKFSLFVINGSVIQEKKDFNFIVSTEKVVEEAERIAKFSEVTKDFFNINYDYSYKKFNEENNSNIKINNICINGIDDILLAVGKGQVEMLIKRSKEVTASFFSIDENSFSIKDVSTKEDIIKDKDFRDDFNPFDFFEMNGKRLNIDIPHDAEMEDDEILKIMCEISHQIILKELKDKKYPKWIDKMVDMLDIDARTQDIQMYLQEERDSLVFPQLYAERMLVEIKSAIQELAKKNGINSIKVEIYGDMTNIDSSCLTVNGKIPISKEDIKQEIKMLKKNEKKKYRKLI